MIHGILTALLVICASGGALVVAWSIVRMG